jgi:hypothetical protein
LLDEVLAYRHEPSSRGPNLADHPKIRGNTVAIKRIVDQ